MQLDHVTLNVSNMDEIVSFYRDVLGMQAEQYEEWQRGTARFPSLRANKGFRINLFPPDRWDGNGKGLQSPDSLNHLAFSFAREEWNTLLRRLEHRGVTVIEGPVRREGSKGMGESIYVLDPEGRKLELKVY